MTINKVILGEETVLDLTEDTVEKSALLEGYTAHDKSGNIITGALNVSIKAQAKTVTPTMSKQNVFPDVEEGFNYLSSVTVEPIPAYTQPNDYGQTLIIG